MTSQDFKKGIDLTGLTTISASEMIQLVDAGEPADDKGLIIVTTDTANFTPVVPNPDVLLEGKTPTHWKRYIWMRKPFDPDNFDIQLYVWQEGITPDATYLNWEPVFDLTNLQDQILDISGKADNALNDASSAVSTAEVAETNSAAAVAQVAAINTSIATINASITTINTKNSQQDNLIGDLNGQILDLQDAAARSNSAKRIDLGMQYTPLGVCILQDIKASGVSGGLSVAGTWTKRTLNDRKTLGEGSVVALNGDNTFTLPAGSYLIEAEAPGFLSDNHQIKLIVTGSIGTVAYGSIETSGQSFSTQTRSKLMMVFTITDSTTYEIQHNVTTPNVNGFGEPGGFGGSEVYTQVKITVMNL